MPAIKYQELKRRYDLNGAKKTVQHLKESLDKGDLKPDDFSLRDLAEALVDDGREWVRSLDPRRGGLSLVEAASVNTAAFSNITGQIVYSMMMEKYNSPQFYFTSLIPTKQTRLSGEKIPGVTGIGDATSVVAEEQAYPLAGVSEDYQETPATTKRGVIVPVTKEAIFFDRTNLVLERAAAVGEAAGVNKEKRLVDLVLGVTNNYKWKGTAYNTYQATTPWINIKTGQTLVDWNNVDAAEQILYAIVDPNTGEPVVLSARHIVVNRAYLRAAERAVYADRIEVATPGFAVSANPTVTQAKNPMSGRYQVIDSQYVNARQTAASQDARYWYIGDLTKAFAYMENWPITVTQSAQNSEAEFNNDIVARFKVSERGEAVVMNPRYVVRVTE